MPLMKRGSNVEPSPDKEELTVAVVFTKHANLSHLQTCAEVPAAVQ